jgi:PAS domain-containing protein
VSQTPSFRFFNEAAGVRGRHLFALAEDHAGRIYIAGGYGVDRMNPENGFAVHFAASGGLPEGETHRLFCDRRGDVWFASDFGLSRYTPEADSTAPPAAPTIREVKVSGVIVLRSDEGESQTGLLSIPPGKDSIEITYGSVDFAVGNNLRYRYRLAPGQSEWHVPTEQRTVQYAGIGAGAYRFEVQAVGPTGVTSSGIANLTFRVAPHFWRSWWFLGLTGSVLGGLAWMGHLYRVRHLLGVERMRAHLAADLHDNLGAGLTEIAILAEVAKQQKNTRSLDEVADRARELRSTMGDIVWSVDPECDDLEGLIRRWRQSAFALIGNESLDFMAPPDAESELVPINPDCRRHLLHIFQEILNNIARHSGAEHVRVSVEYARGVLELRIEDDGCGFDPSLPREGNGLRNMAMRAEALRAELHMESRPGHGTRVRVMAPV